MSGIVTGGIDCDIHPSVPTLKALYPYLTNHWRDIIVQRGVTELNSIAYPANSPLSARPDWRIEGIRPGSDLGLLRQHALDPFHTSIAIANCLYGVQLLFSEDMGAGFARAVNDWMAGGVAGQGAAPACLDRRAGAKPRNGGGRDRAGCTRPTLRAGAAAGDGRHAPGQAALLANLRGRRAGTGWRSASTLAARIAIRSRQSAGRPTTRKTMPRRPPVFSKPCRR